MRQPWYNNVIWLFSVTECKHWIYSDFIFLLGNNPCSDMSGVTQRHEAQALYFVSPVIDCKTLFYVKHND